MRMEEKIMCQYFCVQLHKAEGIVSERENVFIVVQI